MINLLQLNLGKQYGGVEKHIEDIVQYIDKNKFNIYIVCRQGTDFEKKIKNKFSKTINVKIMSLQFNKKGIIKSIFKLKKYLKNNNINIVHSHGIFSNIIAIITRNKFIKVINTVHGYSYYDRLERSKFERELFDFIESIGLRKSDLCIAVSRDIKDYLTKKGIKDNKIIVVHHGICRLVDFKPKSMNYNKKIIIGSLGRLEKVKGYDTLIKAIKYCTVNGYGDIFCRIAGNGIEMDNLQNLIHKLELEENCELIGFVEDVDKFLIETDIYIQPSIIESFGLAIIEAMQRGIPVIASNSGGIKEIIESEKNGIMFEKEDYKDLGKCIIYLIENKEKINEIVLNAINKVEVEFNIEDKIKDIENIIISLSLD